MKCKFITDALIFNRMYILFDQLEKASITKTLVLLCQSWLPPSTIFWCITNHTILLPLFRFNIQVLDEEAEVFVVKMWRLLIYELDAKKSGIAGK